MKRNILIVSLLTLIITTGCKSEKKKFTLIGKWQLVEITGFSYEINGDFHEKPYNNKTYLFKANGEVINELDQKGKYQVKKSEDPYFFQLHISFPIHEEYFNSRYDKNDSEKLMLNPADKEYGQFCDEGCTQVYDKD